MTRPFDSFSDEMTKIALVLFPKWKARKFMESESKDWEKFEGNLKSSRFRDSITSHPDADAKLKRYVKSYGSFVASNNAVGDIASTSSPGKSYTIKKLPNGRVGCSCNDWKFNRSHKGQDCKHIQMMKAKTKQSSHPLNIAARGAGIYHKLVKAKKLEMMTRPNMGQAM